MKNQSRFSIIILALTFNFSIQAQPDSCGFDQSVADLMNLVSKTNIEQHIQTLADAGGHQTRVSYTEGSVWAANYVKQTFESFPGLTSVAFDTFFIFNAPAPYDTIHLVNVVATLEGNSGDSEYYLIGGHLDATANLDQSLNWATDWPTAKAQGADDNASGIAATLEIARVLSDPDNYFSHDKTIKFVAFGAEERHPAYNNDNHKGSQHFVHNAFVRGDAILGAYILDMIGFNNTGNDYFNIASDNRSRDLGRRMLEAKTTYSLNIDANMEPFPDPTYSDHDQFWIYRYPAILIIENAPPWSNNPPWYGANPFYHRLTDTPATVNLDQVQKIAQLTLATIACLSAVVTSIEPQIGATPKSFALLPNYPNPFNPSTNIGFQIADFGFIDLKIYNIAGRLVKTVVHEKREAGVYSVQWDATNNFGEKVASGIYLVALRFERQQLTQKVLLIR